MPGFNVHLLLNNVQSHLSELMTVEISWATSYYIFLPYFSKAVILNPGCQIRLVKAATYSVH